MNPKQKVLLDEVVRLLQVVVSDMMIGYQPGTGNLMHILDLAETIKTNDESLTDPGRSSKT